MLETLIPVIGGGVVSGVATYLVQYLLKVHPIEKEFESFKKSATYWTPVDFPLILDGAKESGKSALVARWINPNSDITQLGGTTALATQGPVHMCSRFHEKNGNRYEDRYRLTIYDMGGEYEDTLAQIFDDHPVAVAVLVIDPTNLEKSLARFSPGVLMRTYLNPTALDSLRCIIIYIAKSDIATTDQIKTTQDAIQRNILTVIGHRFPQGDRSLVFVGSAKTGQNLHEALGFIARALDVAKYYEMHKSMSRASSSAEMAA